MPVRWIKPRDDQFSLFGLYLKKQALSKSYVEPQLICGFQRAKADFLHNMCFQNLDKFRPDKYNSCL